uniref:Uncharacterized protein n=1 Tax=Candidatus Methanogaster sp. ANME-2c ERB4 TaxID=2759911 RepID=A0A7G9YMQ7_9EURY|nr:hypothetical protein ANJBEOKM_00031 [Methanosarcinales archaeon ANME-2c ERB4]
MNKITESQKEKIGIELLKNQATNTSTPSPANYTRVNGHE